MCGSGLCCGTGACAEAAEINLRSDIHNAAGITLDETTTRENVAQLFNVLLGDSHGLKSLKTLDKDVALDTFHSAKYAA
ncbi:hypothetical protein KCP77_06290 [Salmonella enterica subsp. enterica]|nr:hypothetical protein KCP77_06290 [Salmonella enterica subsp. enterica]